MTALGFQVGWLAARVSLFAVCVAPMIWLCGRRSARGGANLGVVAFAIVLLLSAIAVVPLPDFGNWFLASQGVRSSIIRDQDQRSIADASADETGFNPVRLWVEINKFTQISDVQSAASISQTGVLVVAIMYCVGAALAGLRLLFAYCAARKLCHVSQTIVDQRLLEALRATQLVLGCSRSADVRECQEPGLAATFGSWQPVIILPPEWRQWSECELQAVLAHELSHICHRDSLSRFLARLCQSLHFLNPLVHWLSAQLHWHQELAADLVAMSTFKDRHDYVKSLASIALYSPARTPTKALLGSAINGSDLIRRIEMLRRNSKSQTLDWRLRGVLVAVLSIFGLAVSSLGGWTTPPKTGTDQPEPFEIGYLPESANGFLALRPAVVLAQPGMDTVKAKVAAGLRVLKENGFAVPDALRPENIEQIVMNFGITSQGTGKPGSRAVMLGSDSLYIRLKDEFDWPAFIGQYSRWMAALTNGKSCEVKETREDGVTVYSLESLPRLGSGPVVFAMPDRRSVIFCAPPRETAETGIAEHAAYLRQLIRNAAPTRQRDWGSLDKVIRAPIALVLDNRHEFFNKTLEKDTTPEVLATLAKVRHAAVAIELGEGQPIRVVLDSKSEPVATEVKVGLTEEVTKEWRKLEQEKAEGKSEKLFRTLFSDMERTGGFRQHGSRLEWQAYSTLRVADFLNLIKE